MVVMKFIASDALHILNKYRLKIADPLHHNAFDRISRMPLLALSSAGTLLSSNRCHEYSTAWHLLQQIGDYYLGVMLEGLSCCQCLAPAGEGRYKY